MEPVSTRESGAGQGIPDAVALPSPPGTGLPAISAAAGTLPEPEVLVPPLRALLAEIYGTGGQDWQDRAVCAETDPEAFFPEKGGSVLAAKKVCRACEVRADCLKYALDNDERFGIWGGLSERERRRLKRQAG